MAAITAPGRTAAQHQSLLHFVGQGAWSDEDVLTKVRQMVLPQMTRVGLSDADADVDDVVVAPVDVDADLLAKVKYRTNCVDCATTLHI